MLKILGSQEAQNTLLKRIPLDDMPVSDRILSGIEAIFGASLTPEEAVRKILHDVQREGDEALQKWSSILDGLDTKDFRVSKSAIATSKNKISEREINALVVSTDRIRRFYSRQPLHSWIMQESDGTLACSADKTCRDLRARWDSTFAIHGIDVCCAGAGCWCSRDCFDGSSRKRDQKNSKYNFGCC